MPDDLSQPTRSTAPGDDDGDTITVSASSPLGRALGAGVHEIPHTSPLAAAIMGGAHNLTAGTGAHALGALSTPGAFLESLDAGKSIPDASGAALEKADQTTTAVQAAEARAKEDQPKAYDIGADVGSGAQALMTGGGGIGAQALKTGALAAVQGAMDNGDPEKSGLAATGTTALLGGVGKAAVGKIPIIGPAAKSVLGSIGATGARLAGSEVGASVNDSQAAAPFAPGVSHLRQLAPDFKEPALAPWRPILSQSLAKGDDQFRAAVFVLMQTDPEFQKQMRALNDKPNAQQ